MKYPTLGEHADRVLSEMRAYWPRAPKTRSKYAERAQHATRLLDPLTQRQDSAGRRLMETDPGYRAEVRALTREVLPGEDVLEIDGTSG